MIICNLVFAGFLFRMLRIKATEKGALKVKHVGLTSVSQTVFFFHGYCFLKICGAV